MQNKTFTNISFFGSVNIPLTMCESVGFKQGQRVEVSVEEGKIIVKAAEKRHYFKHAAKAVKDKVEGAVRGRRGRRAATDTNKTIKENIDRGRKGLTSKDEAIAEAIHESLEEQWEESPTAI